jgi:hypothetical protein
MNFFRGTGAAARPQITDTKANNRRGRNGAVHFMGPAIMAVEGYPCASWELKYLERDILCHGTKPDMPELWASNDPATHDGER